MSLLFATISDPTGLPDVVPVGPRHRLLRKTRSSFAALRMTINGSRASSRTVAEGLPAHLSSVDPPYTLLANAPACFCFSASRKLDCSAARARPFALSLCSFVSRNPPCHESENGCARSAPHTSVTLPADALVDALRPATSLLLLRLLGTSPMLRPPVPLAVFRPRKHQAY